MSEDTPLVQLPVPYTDQDQDLHVTIRDVLDEADKTKLVDMILDFEAEQAVELLLMCRNYRLLVRNYAHKMYIDFSSFDDNKSILDAILDANKNIYSVYNAAVLLQSEFIGDNVDTAYMASRILEMPYYAVGVGHTHMSEMTFHILRKIDIPDIREAFNIENKLSVLKSERIKHRMSRTLKGALVADCIDKIIDANAYEDDGDVDYVAALIK